ncbi:tRNA lysidine(34) synthetase TilS [Amphibiibacter pelophylacis]|uniref:tRNA lysidine(34) synthetase TilS n=1 Tax=Amphibiibacter pelophylacis TaxID=1799477 RepID=A0ACC6NYZ1_9BURK
MGATSTPPERPEPQKRPQAPAHRAPGALALNPRWLAQVLGAEFARPRAIAVACSGGRDSIALLHATVAAAKKLAQAAPSSPSAPSAPSSSVTVHALHVHHGLMAQADAWADGLMALCAQWAARGDPVTGQVSRLHGQPAPGESIEAWARRGRYAALGRMARAAGCQAVLLAHHRQDQIETVLLQLLRSAGPAGLAAMPSDAQRDGLRWLRPWLDEAPKRIAAYAATHALPVVHDPSNTDPRHTRSRLRHAVLPALEAAFPHAASALSHAARRAAQAADALNELAELDAAQALAGSPPRLDISAWLRLSPARRGILLRHWLGQLTAAPPETLIARLQAELPRATTGQRWPLPGGAWLVARRGWLGTAHPGPPAPTAQPAPPDQRA